MYAEGLRGAGGFNWQPVVKKQITLHLIAHLYSLPSNTHTKENETNVLAMYVSYICERNWNKKANAKMAHSLNHEDI